MAFSPPADVEKSAARRSWDDGQTDADNLYNYVWTYEW
jgi:hypothetical protein